eukprot:1159719-Prymnesium_polylepis.1
MHLCTYCTYAVLQPVRRRSRTRSTEVGTLTSYAVPVDVTRCSLGVRGESSVYSLYTHYSSVPKLKEPGL